MSPNAYTFLPWLRTGISTKVTTPPQAGVRATVKVQLLVSGEPITGHETLTQPVNRDVQLYGPGDVVGVDPRAISRTEPRAGVTNFEPNYLAHIEFSEEDFLWRYSPGAADGHTARLTPWLALVVLATGSEFTEVPKGAGPLPAISVADPAGTLPPPDQLGAWAHVHVNGSLADPVATDGTAAALAALTEVVRTNADNACSRLICPRHLRPGTAYEAFLVPTFESGRLAGLGLDPAVAPNALYSSWGPHYANRPAEGVLPYYHRWAFATGTAGDFEFLVRLLRPQAPDPRIGRRPLDVHGKPGLDLPPITDQGGVLPLRGALKVPERAGDPIDPAENWDHFVDTGAAPPYPHPFEQAMAGLLNLADDYQRHEPAAAHAASPAATAGPDPVITPPLYGRWHALTTRLLNDENGTPVSPEVLRGWLHRLNLDPRFRIAAGLGTQVVRAHDEELMAAAWAQVGDVLVANGRIRAAQLAREVGNVLQAKHIDPPTGSAPAALAAAPASAPGRSLTLTAPAHSRVTTAASSSSFAAGDGTADAGGGSGRPAAGSPAATADGTGSPTAAGSRTAGGDSGSPAAAGDGSPTTAGSPTAGGDSGSPTAAGGATGRDSTAGLAAGPAALGAGVGASGGAGSRIAAAGGAVGLVADPAGQVAAEFRVASSRVAAAPVSPAMRRITRPGSRLMRTLPFPGQSAAALLSRMDAPVDPVVAAPVKVTPGALVTPRDLAATLHPAQPPGADPVGSLPRSPDFVLRALGDPVAPHPGTSDSAEAQRFKAALRELHQGFDAGVAVGHVKPAPPLDVVGTAASVLTGLNAEETVPRALLEGSVSLPERLRPFAAGFIEAMAYPVFDVPAYRTLLDISVDSLVPNLSLLPPNSITLLANNREFIESFLVGLNHEMARELLWREYPTDQRGTPFRQFWDPVATLPVPNETAGLRRERGYDIPPIHEWPATTRLGDNENRQPDDPRPGGPQRDDLVLVVRGELLKKYPTAAIYAQRAQFPGNDPTQPRELADLPTDGLPSPEQIRLPRYEAKVEPDIYLLGFDLDADEALGTPGVDPGWFFVLKERPGDPRFGVDDGPPTHVEVWNDLTWDDVDPHRTGFLELDPAVQVALGDFDHSDDDREKKDQRAEDENLPLWFSGLGSADLAYILFQVPVMVAVHAQEMLPR
ncbi:hypothetical protein [Amycolatopsis sp. NPDC021455]|uniref:hypothetical protein n=1 Tax=Amycolatopsis sp. NPDC021455 TaxID=3154901 RepID=UPI0033DECACA